MSLGSQLLGGVSLIGWGANTIGANTISTVTIDAALEALIFIGHIVTEDGASHTIDTTGSSSLNWRTGSLTFANAGTSVSIGLAAVDTANGSPGRAVNVADAITFDVASVKTGGGGGITANAWQTSVPTTGTKTIANGDLVAFAIQMVTRGGADSIALGHASNTQSPNRPAITSFTGAAYASVGGLPDMVIVFSDGTRGWFHGGEVASAFTIRTYNSGSSPNEYGKLFQFSGPLRIAGIWAIVDPDGDFDAVLYSDPLGTPVAEKTVSFDLNTSATATSRRTELLFASPYDTTANQVFAVVIKPSSGTNMSMTYKTLAAAADRVTDPGGTSSYGVSRSGGSGAFANANSSLDHYPVGIMLQGFDTGGGGAGILPGSNMRGGFQ